MSEHDPLCPKHISEYHNYCECDLIRRGREEAFREGYMQAEQRHMEEIVRGGSELMKAWQEQGITAALRAVETLPTTAPEDYSSDPYEWDYAIAVYRPMVLNAIKGAQ